MLFIGSLQFIALVHCAKVRDRIEKKLQSYTHTHTHTAALPDLWQINTQTTKNIVLKKIPLFIPLTCTSNNYTVTVRDHAAKC